MNAIDQILKLLKRIGIPFIAIVLVVGAVSLYKSYLEVKLLTLQIKQIKGELGEDENKTKKS